MTSSITQVLVHLALSPTARKRLQVTLRLAQEQGARLVAGYATMPAFLAASNRRTERPQWQQYRSTHPHSGVNRLYLGHQCPCRSGKEKTVVTLTPDDDKSMKGMGKYASNPAMKAIVTITLPGRATEQARFTPLAAASDGHTDHKH